MNKTCNLTNKHKYFKEKSKQNKEKESLGY